MACTVVQHVQMPTSVAFGAVSQRLLTVCAVLQHALNAT